MCPEEIPDRPQPEMSQDDNLGSVDVDAEENEELAQLDEGKNQEKESQAEGGSELPLEEDEPNIEEGIEAQATSLAPAHRTLAWKRRLRPRRKRFRHQRTS